MPLEERTIKEWRQIVQLDFADLFLGKRLGGGLSREVFVFALDESLVVKVETEPYFQNVIEHKVWDVVHDTEWAKWFAPVKYISPLGVALIQERTTDAPAKTKVKFPELVPDFLADARECNWGWLNGRWVVHDYGFNNLLPKGFKRVRMVKPDKVSGI